MLKSDNKCEKRPKIAVVLSGGGVGAFAHVGFLKVLEKEGFTPDLVVGTSGGAIIGALYASGMTISDLEELGQIAMSEGWREILINPLPRLNGLISSENIKMFFNKYCKVSTFEEMKIPLAVTATELRTFKQVVFTKGNAGIAIQASCSVPGLFTPLVRGDEILVDGGMYSNLPCEVARAMGADFIIASDSLAPVFKPDNLSSSLRIVSHTVYSLLKRITSLTEHVADHVIRTEHKDATVINFRYIKELLDLGEINTRSEIEEIMDKYIQKQYNVKF